MPALRPAAEITRAIERLNAEELIPLADLAGLPVVLAGVESRPPVRTLLRWGQTGRNGVYLDVLWQRSRLTWVTSRAALARFVAAVEAASTGKTATVADLE
jgi:hypothetical protein